MHQGFPQAKLNKATDTSETSKLIANGLRIALYRHGQISFHFIRAYAKTGQPIPQSLTQGFGVA